MEQDWFLYCCTLFTFAAIFGLCYIRHTFTFFERNKIAFASYPNFPFGNIYDVFFRNTAMSMQLWKYHNRFKKKKCKFGGFYVFLKPAILAVDPEIARIISSKEDSFREIEVIKFDLEEDLLGKILENFPNWPSIASISETFVTEEVNFSNLMNLYVIEVSESEFLATKNAILIDQIRGGNNFSSFLKLIGIPTIFYASIDKYKNTYRKILESLIEERKRRNLQKNDILQTLLDYNFSIDRITNIIFGLIYNLQISVNLLTFTLFELSLNQEIQEDLRGEILRFKKSNTIIALEDLSKLSYLETVICETLRKYPLKPFTCQICLKDFEQNGLKFEINRLFFLSIFGIHHDPQNYVNPELFDPDRFSEENQKFVDPLKYRPFGFKNREASESKYVTVVMKLMLIELITKFKFSLGKKSSKVLEFEERQLELKTKNDMWFKMEKY